MKKSIFLAALVLFGASCFAQKANVSKARNLVDAEVWIDICNEFKVEVNWANK